MQIFTLFHIVLLFTQHKVWKALENNPIFAHPNTKRTLLDERKAILEQVFRLQEHDFLGESRGEVGDPILVKVCFFGAF